MEENTILDPEMNVLLAHKESGYNYQERRHSDWTENYTLYRDKVVTNRLTQRQSVNLPIMKQTVKTIFKDIDDMPVIEFENLDNDKQAEVFQNEYWKWTLEKNNAEIKDAVDKKQDILFGRTFDQWQVVDGCIMFTIEDPADILVDRYCDPSDLDTSRFLIHTHIFKPISYLEKNENYDQEKVAELKNWYMSEQGLIKQASNEQMYIDKTQKMVDLGLTDANDPLLGETIVELNMYFVYEKGEDDEEEQLYQYVTADDIKVLMKKPLEEVLGKTKSNYWRNHFNYCSWADDVDRQDFWTDGPADIARTPNKVLNAWVSQLVENRTLRNFGMHYYNSSLEGFQPQTWTPQAWGWYGIPVPQGSSLSEVMQKVDIPDLSESLDEMQYIVEMTEKGTGATPTAQGVQTERQVTLGEVQLALGEAKERIKGMSKFYTHAWKKRAEKFLMLIESAHDKLDAVKIYKKGRNSADIYQREIEPKDWMTESGYRVRIWSQDEKDAQDVKGIEKLSAVRANIPGNSKLEEIFKRKMLEFANLTPDEVNEIMEIEQQKQEALMQAMQQGMMTPDMMNPAQAPQQPQMV